MFGGSVMEKFKSLDVYRKLPSDYLQPTYSGATCTIINNSSIYDKHSHNGNAFPKRIKILY